MVKLPKTRIKIIPKRLTEKTYRGTYKRPVTYFSEIQIMGAGDGES